MIKLHKDEKIILEARKHWFILFAEALFLAFLLVLPIVVAIGANILNASKFITVVGDSTFLFIILTAAWLLFIWITFFVIWTNYYLDILVVTNKRIIDIDQGGLFSREVSTSMLENLEDITIEVHGIIATLLDFGNIHLQTAAESREFVVEGIPNPVKVKGLIFEAYNNVESKNHHT